MGLAGLSAGPAVLFNNATAGGSAAAAATRTAIAIGPLASLLPSPPPPPPPLLVCGYVHTYVHACLERKGKENAAALPLLCSALVFKYADVHLHLCWCGDPNNTSQDNVKLATSVMSRANNATWEMGVSSEIKAAPEGFVHRTLLVTAAGPTRAMLAWGEMAQKDANLTARFTDLATTKLGYFTDNGAMLYVALSCTPRAALHGVCYAVA